MHPEYKAKPRVYYLGIPRKFVAGAVYDPEADECTVGAKIALTNLKTKKSQTAKTDEFGDFWFEGLDVGEYSLKVENDGYYTQKIESIKTEKDVNVGDIKLYKKAQVAS